MRIPISQRRKGQALWARRGRGFSLPYEVNFSSLSDGVLPIDIWNGGTWSIVSGKAVNTPTLGSEILGDPGLETAYVSGRCGSLSLTDADVDAVLVDETVDIHGGSHAQKVTFGDAIDFLQVSAGAGVADRWYQYSVWGKRTAGSNGNTGISVFQTAMLPETANSPFADITAASYTQHKIAFYSASTNTMFARPALQLSTAGDTVIVDDHSLKQITRSSIYTLGDFTITDGVWKMRPDTFVDNSLSGIVVRADGNSDPTNCIYAVIEKQPRANSVLIYLMKKLSTTTSLVMTVQTAAIVADAWFEVRASGTTISVWYNGVQVGTNQTVADANLNTTSNKYAGMWSTGDNRFKSFFVSAS